ncbi:MAG: hypothetical protein J2P49_02990 [Methylocapsa sp.]|nr:hypothetical protein [Methylocapsa sp.]
MSDSNNSSQISGYFLKLAGVFIGISGVLWALMEAISPIAVLHEQYCYFRSWAFSPILKIQKVPGVVGG